MDDVIESSEDKVEDAFDTALVEMHEPRQVHSILREAEHVSR